jgi:hypothetical protein
MQMKMMWSVGGNVLTGEKMKYCEDNLSHWPSVHHKPYMD